MRQRKKQGLIRALVALLALGAAGARAAPPSIAGLSTEADGSKGGDIFQDRCSMCHLEEGQGQGPNLKGVVGRKAAALPDFAYTSALKGSGLVWTPQTLDTWLQGPSKLVPGTTMPTVVPKPDERAELIAYLDTLK